MTDNTAQPETTEDLVGDVCAALLAEMGISNEQIGSVREIVWRCDECGHVPDDDDDDPISECVDDADEGSESELEWCLECFDGLIRPVVVDIVERSMSRLQEWVELVAEAYGDFSWLARLRPDLVPLAEASWASVTSDAERLSELLGVEGLRGFVRGFPPVRSSA